MPIFRGIAVVLAAVALVVPGVASARATTMPTTGAGVSKHPPVPFAQHAPKAPVARDRAPAIAAAPSPSATAAGDLPNTGADPRLVFLMGAALTLVGVGLRLQTADADGN